LIEKAHQICAYSNATRNNVAVKLGLVEPLTTRAT
jgi:organic hydroperoxide reductase OsmC/OhrA